MGYSLFPGRFQPFHDGHKAIIQKLLDEGKEVVVGIRDTQKSEQNPYSMMERVSMIKAEFPEVMTMMIPDIEEIVYGREVGYQIREVRLSPELEAISATKIRNDNLDNG